MRFALDRVPRFLRRPLKRLMPMPRMDVVFSPGYSRAAFGVPGDPLRAEKILTFLTSERLCEPDCVHKPWPASIRTLRRVHTDEYLESLREEATLARVVGVEGGTAELDRLVDVQREMVGGTNMATRLVLESGRVALHLGGGLHHAWADRGQGFCLLNDVAAAIASQRVHGFKGRVMVIDLDLHHGDGTEAIFARDETVYTYSIHNRNWADVEAVASTSIALGDGVEDGPYLAALAESLPGLVRSFRPELVYFLAGCDPAAGDLIGDWKISAEGMAQRDHFVLSLLRDEGMKIPTVILLAGGYGPEAWRYTARSIGRRLAASPHLEPPTTDEVTLRRYRTLAQLVDPSELSGATDEGDNWGLSSEDLAGAFDRATPVRFLDFYTRPGIELVLERYGLLDRLRQLGFRHFSLEWNLEDASGQTIRLFGDGLLVAELRARRDRRVLPGMETLHLEWLLLQNPRADFPAGAHPLPGQERPGLGMLRDVMALMVVICDRLKLDGISFVPAHFHLAASATKLMRFVDPLAEARLRAAFAPVAELPLAQASAMVAAGRVRDATTGEPYRYEPTVSVLPVSERLKAHLDSAEMLRSRDEAAALTHRFELMQENP